MAARLEKSISEITDRLNALTANVIMLLTISFERGILKQRDFLVPLFWKVAGTLPVFDDFRDCGDRGEGYGNFFYYIKYLHALTSSLI